MIKIKPSFSSLSFRLTLALLIILLWVSPWTARPVQAGTGTTVDVPFSTILPSMDGVCDPTEYADAAQVIIPVGPSQTFPVYMKHTIDNAYFCFGDTNGLPQPNGGQPSIAIYIDPNNDGAASGNNSDDFGIWMYYDPLVTTGVAHSWSGTPDYQGVAPGGWQVVKHQVGGGTPNWQVEYRITRATMGGWKRSVGLALFYHWWQSPSNDYSWPANGIWANAPAWGNAYFSMPKVDIDISGVIPTVNGQCTEYGDASTVSFNTPNGSATAYLKHSLTDLYVCIHYPGTPAVSQQNSPNAALLIDRAYTGGATPNAGDILMTISYSGTNIQANTGDGSGFTIPLVGDYQVMASQTAGGWDAEFRLSGTVIGSWWARHIGLSVAELNVNNSGDYFAWPAGSTDLIPFTWGDGNLINLGQQLYLPTITR